MAIMFHNVKTGERRLCTTEPMIAAHLNTSDRNPNAHSGQDMGWRISPKTVLELERLSQDADALRKIATDFGIPSDEVKETDVLMWISRQSDRGMIEEKFDRKDFEREYENDIRRLRDEQERRDKVIAAEARSKGERVPQRILDQEKEQANSQPAPVENDTMQDEQTAPIDINNMKRPELNAYAETVGIENPESFSRADELRDAIKAKEAEEA